MIDNFKQTINLHPFFYNQTNKYGFLIDLTQRYIPNSTTGNMKINSHGVICNGHNNDLLNSFPEKPEKFFRIFMLGGSSLAENTMN